jgi:hypothetical protein
MICTISRAGLPGTPFYLSFTSLHLTFTTFGYQSAYYPKGEAVKAKKRKLYLGGFLPYFFNFVPKRVRFVPKGVRRYMLKNKQ